MKFFTQTVLAAAVLGTLHILLLALAPDKYRREIKAIISLITVITIASLLSGADFSDITSSLKEIELSESVYSNDELVKKDLEGRIEQYLEALLSEQGIECKKISVGTTIDESRRIFITKASLRLSEEYSDREPEIRELIKTRIGEIGTEISYEDG